MTRTTWRNPDPPTLGAAAQQRLNGWVAMLDVDLELAQAMLRLDPTTMPLPPCPLPPVVDWDGTVLAEPIAEHQPPVAVPAAPSRRGAYARRAHPKGTP